jgi:hypothetical protein
LTRHVAAAQHRRYGNDHVAPIRILLAAMPRLMRDIVEAELLTQPDMTLVGRPETAAGLADEVRTSAPDFVLIGDEQGCDLPQLLAARPWMRVLVIEGRAAGVHLHELHPRRFDLGPMSAPELIATIRGAGRAVPPATSGC